MAQFATYRGDVCENIIGQVMGPDLYGGWSEAVEADYDPDSNTTRVRFAPLALHDYDKVREDEFGQPRVYRGQ